MILDGWGKSPDPKVSAIDNANIPFINSLYKITQVLNFERTA
jgi:2,3-bisphosphoglycerate-independent phosphoglycerate mutase